MNTSAIDHGEEYSRTSEERALFAMQMIRTSAYFDSRGFALWMERDARARAGVFTPLSMSQKQLLAHYTEKISCLGEPIR